MSNVKPVAKQTVKIKENDLVELIDSIVSEAVATKKQEWLNEQAIVLETRLSVLEQTIKTLTESKK